jgi:hypothetical protein
MFGLLLGIGIVLSGHLQERVYLIQFAGTCSRMSFTAVSTEVGWPVSIFLKEVRTPKFVCSNAFWMDMGLWSNVESQGFAIVVSKFLTEWERDVVSGRWQTMRRTRIYLCD